MENFIKIILLGFIGELLIFQNASPSMLTMGNTNLRANDDIKKTLNKNITKYIMVLNAVLNVDNNLKSILVKLKINIIINIKMTER